MPISILSSLLSAAWNRVEFIYSSGAICSERHLQAELFHILQNDVLFTNSFQVFIEPSICAYKDNDKYTDMHGLIPDMIITRETKIVGIVELKYNPLGYVQFQKDLSTFSAFFEQKGGEVEIYLRTDPVNGDFRYDPDHTFKLAEDLLLIYGIIGNADSHAITNAENIWTNTDYVTKPLSNYLQLIGEVNPSSKQFRFYSIPASTQSVL